MTQDRDTCLSGPSDAVRDMSSRTKRNTEHCVHMDGTKPPGQKAFITKDSPNKASVVFLSDYDQRNARTSIARVVEYINIGP